MNQTPQSNKNSELTELVKTNFEQVEIDDGENLIVENSVCVGSSLRKASEQREHANVRELIFFADDAFICHQAV